MVEFSESIEILDDNNIKRIELIAYGIIAGRRYGTKMFFRNGDNIQTVLIDQSAIRMGGNNTYGYLALFPRSARDIGDSAEASIGLNGGTSEISLANKIILQGEDADIMMGGNNKNGNLLLFPRRATDIRDFAQASIQLNGGRSEISLANKMILRGDYADILMGGNGRNGDLLLFPTTATNLDDRSQASIQLNGGRSEISLANKIILQGEDADILMGGNGRNGDLLLFPTTATNLDDRSQASIQLNGGTGDIILGNADCAEDFDITELEEVEPGTVMVIDQDGKLMQSKEAYDKRVVGVLSAAGDLRPGIILDKKQSKNKRMPLALMGKVQCKVDAQYSPVEVGDLLTTSPTPGHAMKADDPLKAFGAVIGKALRSMKESKGLIPILVALQ